MSEAAEVMKRRIHVVNLDPAAEHFDYEVAIDIRDLISLDDAVEEMVLIKWILLFLYIYHFLILYFPFFRIMVQMGV